MRREQGGRRRLAGVVRVLGTLALVGVVLHVAQDSPANSHGRGVPVRPNVVVVMTDDQTVESVRVMKNVRRLLAATGTTFANSFASFPLCCPSRATLLTGQYSHNHGVVGNSLANGLGRLDEGTTLPVWLSRAGYATVMVGKYLNGYGAANRMGVPPGWSEWNAAVKVAYFEHSINRNGRLVVYGKRAPSYQTDVFTNLAVDAIRRHATAKRPFFLWLSYFAPHHGGPREAADPPELKTPVPAPRHRGRFATERLPTPPAFNEADVSDKPGAVRVRPLLDERMIGALTRSYQQRLESLLAVDEGIARIVSALRAAGALKNTLIVFTSDNGYLEGEHRITDGKQVVYEPSVRVPLIVSGPGVPRGVRLEQMVANVDVAPTIVEAARAQPDRMMDGRSLWPLLLDTGIHWGRDILFERGPGASPSAARLYTAIRSPRFVYAEHATGERELYDLAVDPDQLRSGHADPAYSAVQAELARRLEVLRSCAGALCQQPPALTIAPVLEGACARSVRVGGSDERFVDYVDFIADGRAVRRVDDPPFEQRLSGGALTNVRAVATFGDGRRLSLDLVVGACAARQR